MPRKAQPGALPTGRPYGERADLARAEQALPIPVTPAGPAPATAAPVSGGGAGGLAAAMAELGQMSPMAELPGGTDHIDPNVARPISTMPPAPVDSAVAKYLPMLETAANAPNASWVLRQYVRRLRAQTPVTTDLANPNVVG